MEIAWVAGRLGEIPRYSENAARLTFDLASLTKVIATSSLLVELLARDNFSFLEKPLVDWIPELKSTSLKETVLRDFWEHKSGLCAHAFLFAPESRKRHGGTRETLHDFLLQEILKFPLGTPGETLYSDLGFIVLGIFLERFYSRDIGALWADYAKLHLPKDSHLQFESKGLSHLVPTEQRHGVGEVNDDNAFCMGGLAPHAGLFATAKEVWDWLEFFSDRLQSYNRLWDIFCHPKGRFVLGWDSPTSSESHAGSAAAPTVRGHLGYTGTSLFWDIATGVAGVHLSNRVFPAHSESSKNEIRVLRQQFYSKLWTKS